MTTQYPPSPWHLRGTVHLTWWWTGRGLTATIFAEYLPEGDLAYHELALVRLVWRRGPALTIPTIWVDSAAARDGGQEMWDIPKDLAAFRMDEQSLSAEGLAQATVERSVPLGYWPFSTRTVQPRCTSRLKIKGRVSLVRLKWQFLAGDLVHLQRAKQILSLRVCDAKIIFR